MPSQEKRPPLTPKEIELLPDLSDELVIEKGGKEPEEVIELKQEMIKKREQPVHIKEALDKLKQMNAERRLRAEKAMERAEPLVSSSGELKPGDVIELQALTREQLAHEIIAAKKLDRQVAELTNDFTNLEKQWFAEGEATIELGGKTVRLADKDYIDQMRENLGLDKKEVVALEQAWDDASPREQKEWTEKISRTINETELKKLPEYQAVAKLAEELADMEEHLEEVAGADFDKGKTNLASAVKNKLLFGWQRLVNKNFKRYYASYEAKEKEYREKFNELENLGVFAGKSRANRALDARLRGIIDDLRTRVKQKM